MGLFRNIDIRMILQATPSLLIALLGTTLSGKRLDLEQSKAVAQRFPILLLANCMLTFKGNAELIFTLHLSSYSQSKDINFRKYLKFALSNAALVLVQSVLIGITLGLLAFARDILLTGIDTAFFIRIVFVCLFVSVFSSFAIIFVLVPAVFLAVLLGANPDNIVLPVISAAGDVLDIALLSSAIERFENVDIRLAAVGTVGILGLLPCLAVATLLSPHRVPLQSLSVLAATYILSTSSSYAVQLLSPYHLLLAAATPIFCGLSGAVTYIYLNRRITALQLKTPLNKTTAHVSLLATAVVVGAICAIIMPIVGIKACREFHILFVFGFMLSVAILLRVCEVIVQKFDDDVANAGVFSVPLITSIADFLGTFIIIATSIAVYGYR